MQTMETGVARRLLHRPPGFSEQRLLASLVNSADDAIFAKAIDGTIMSWNAGAERMYGYSAAEIVGSSVARLAPPERAEEIVGLLARVASGQAVDQFETVRVARDGHRLRVSLTISPIRDGRGRIVGASTVAREITPAHLADVRTSAQRDLLERVPAAVVGVDRDGNVRLWNVGAVELFGWAAEDVLGRPVFGDIRPLFRDEPVRTEVAVRRRDGSSREVLAAAFPVRDGAGVILEHVAIAIDISQHIRASAALRERETAARASEARVRAFVDQSASPMVIQRDGTIINANRAIVSLFGFDDPVSFAGKQIVDLLTPEAQAIFLAMIGEGAAGVDALADYELTGIRSDGTEFPFLVRRTAIELPDGPATLAHVRDLTQEKRSAAERDWLFAAVEQTAEMVVLTDLQGRIVYANGATLRATGYGQEELAGAPIAKLGPVVEESGDSGAARAATALAAGVAWSGWASYQRAGGGAIEAAVTLSPVRDASGKTVAMITIGRDITLERSLEAQLRHSQKMEAVGQLAGGIAHDFNNLLTAIRGYAELTKRGLPADDEGIRADIEEIMVNADRAAELTRQLLAFSRRQILRPRIVDAADVVEGVVPLLRRLLGAEIELHVSPTPTAGSVLADLTQLEQVIVNLALNARDAMPNGGELTIQTDVVELDAEYARTHAQVVPGHHLMIAIVDTGSGMDAETQSRIFEPFFTTKGPGEGTGLGLATVYGIVRQSGGSIHVYSELGQGSSFKVYLPLVVGSATPQPPERADEPLPTGSERILVVEDEPSVRIFASRVLRDLGYHVLEAPRADFAIALAAKEPGPIELLVTDVVLPLVGGMELARELAGTRPEMRVLFMSGYPERHPTPSRTPLPDNAFLPKPFTANALARAVRDALDRVAGDPLPA